MKDEKVNYDGLFTILIQGPLDDTSLNNISNYKKFGDVVVSYWSDKELDSKYNSQVTPIRGMLPDTQQLYHLASRAPTFYYSLTSMYNGTLACKTPYVVKVRSDESFTDLSHLLDHFLENDERVVCGNIFHKRSKGFHMGDHIFVCKTDVLKATTDFLIKRSQLSEPYEPEEVSKTFPSPEAALCRAMLITAGVGCSKLSYDSYFASVDIRNLGDHCVKWNHGIVTETGQETTAKRVIKAPIKRHYKTKIWDSTKGESFWFPDCEPTL